MASRFHYTSPAKVSLIAVGAAEEVLATVVRGYTGVYDPEIPHEDVDKFLKDLSLTKLQTPASFINTVWLVKNVTRNWTHQMVRTRIGTAFVQESLRFSEKRDAEFFIAATTQTGKTLVREACADALEAYNRLLGLGEEVQNARGILPSCVCTHMFLSINMQALANLYGNRICCQAQGSRDGEWASVLGQIKNLLSEAHPGLANMLQPPWSNPNCISCSFGASFDRPCSNQELFDDNLREQIRARKLSYVEESNHGDVST